MEETAGTGGMQAGYGDMIEAAKWAAEALGTMMYTALYQGGTSAEVNIYMTGRLERAEKRKRRYIGYAAFTVMAVALAAVVIWIAKKNTKN